MSAAQGARQRIGPQGLRARIIRPMNDSPTQHMQCMEVCGGSQLTTRGIVFGGLDAWVYSKPHGQAQRGGDVYYASSCAAGRISRGLLAECLRAWNLGSGHCRRSPLVTIGGDFGVVLPHNDELLSLLVCDVSGHGIGSALIANRIYSETIHELEHNIAPERLLRHLHDFVHDRIGSDGFYFSMAAMRFFQRGHRLTFAAAGHPPAILISSRGLRLLDSQNGILGCLAETAPSEEALDEIDLISGDRLVLYTDGLIEIFNNSDEMLGVEGLKEFVRQSVGKTLPEMRQAILDGVATWRNGPLADDVSLVIVELR